MAGQGVAEKEVRVCTCGAFQPAGIQGILTGQPRRARRRRDSLADPVFVFWALRDSVLALNGCSLPFLNFIFLLVQALCKGGCEPEHSGRQASAPEVLTLTGGKINSPSPRPFRARSGRREGHFCGSGLGTPRGRSGLGSEREIFVSDFGEIDCEVGWICNLWLSSRE